MSVSVSLTNQVMKLCGKMVEAGQTYSAANQLFLSGLAELCTRQEKPSVLSVKELQNYTHLHYLSKSFGHTV